LRRICAARCESSVSSQEAEKTAETGQPFLPAELNRAFALGEEHVDLAKETLILRQATHLDSLTARLREPRLVAIIEPMLAGTTPADLAARRAAA
jgi:hypothetical protein